MSSTRVLGIRESSDRPRELKDPGQAWRVVVAAGVRATLKFSGTQVSPLELELGAGARVTSLRAAETRNSRATPSDIPVWSATWALEERASVDHLDLITGTENVHWKVELRGEKARAHLYGVQGAAEGHRAQTQVDLKHLAPRCRSFQYYKSLASPGGISEFRTRVSIPHHSVESDAHQTHRSLLLGDGAQSISIPELEIDTDSVKCSHGSTTGSLDSQALFYLRSRGLPFELARRVMIRAFADDVLASVETDEFPSLSEQLRDVWHRWVDQQ